MTALPGTGRADVELRVPADSVYASVLRRTAAGLAARLDFTIDDIEDLRMAVGEGSALVLGSAAGGSDLTCGFHLGDGELTVVMSVAADGSTPDADSFAWQVLTTLAQDASVATGDGRVSISFSMRSELSGPAD
jgi:serine/threonine-protein kinase RsbW